LPEGEASAGQSLAIPLLLVLLDPSQHGPQALVGDDVGLSDAGLRVDEHAAGKKLPLVANLDASVFVLVDAAPVTRQPSRRNSAVIRR
jgi:hypothetical protein